MKKTICIIAVFILTGYPSFSQNYQWAKSIGSGNSDYGYSITVDASENVYITGFFMGIADFDPGAGTANLTSVGISDIFFAKYNSSGDYQWAKSIGSINEDRGRSIAVDASGNVYITGNFQGTADFDPGAGTANLTPVGSSDIFFAKYSQQPIIISQTHLFTGTILIAPNPMTNTATLTIPNLKSESSSDFEIQILDLTGKVVRNEPLIPFSHGLSPDKPSHAQITIERGNLKPGIYIVELKAGRTYRGKLIIEQ